MSDEPQTDNQQYDDDPFKQYSDEIFWLQQEKLALQSRIAVLEDCRAVLEHAIELGYLGEGSTASWAKDVLKAARSGG
jgi:hypothetical protein